MTNFPERKGINRLDYEFEIIKIDFALGCNRPGQILLMNSLCKIWFRFSQISLEKGEIGYIVYTADFFKMVFVYTVRRENLNTFL